MYDIRLILAAIVLGWIGLYLILKGLEQIGQGVKCMIGLHKGNVKPADELANDINGRSAFECSHCGKVIE